MNAAQERLTLQTCAEVFTTQAPWGTLVWRRWGEGVPVILLHGGTGSWMHWVRNISALHQDYAVWAPDLPGMGDSDAPQGIEPVEALVEAMARAVNAGLDELSLPMPRHIVGFSFGAMVGAFVAAWQGANAASYTMIGGSGLHLGFPGPGALRKPSADLDADAMRELHRANLAAVMLGNIDAVDDEALEMQLLNAARMRVRSHTAAVTGVMLQPLADIIAPKFAFWGENDPFFPNDGAALESLMVALKIRWVCLPGAAHWGQYQAAAAFNTAIRDILTSRTT
ncbi:MAG: 2-hydroxy-6-oxonona-2,4-dienedioate hydrolase [Gammaproteobacteria bacterium]|jgi:2-hydroxy-6-oxonona-2,4-dienedioate hydrolase